jgi:hypothetical protein
MEGGVLEHEILTLPVRLSWIYHFCPLMVSRILVISSSGNLRLGEPFSPVSYNLTFYNSGAAGQSTGTSVSACR